MAEATARKSWLRKPTLAVASLFFSLLFLSCDDLCANETLKTIQSPDGKRQAVVFRRDCGATTAYSTQVSIMASGVKLPNQGGNVFVADTDHGKAPEQEGGGPVVNVEWLDNKSLRVSYDSKDRVFHKETQQSGVLITYVTAPDLKEK